jgi:hypothetical protein
MVDEARAVLTRWVGSLMKCLVCMVGVVLIVSVYQRQRWGLQMGLCAKGKRNEAE